jgi:cellulose synthase/poly-beta-1,6-N-acetylglucosamine synthase-like glycosyltransferase/peptidoglycan/xylan/chitin deacetylase (PgdA/CDA1 family)/spore germination protein YaaH
VPLSHPTPQVFFDPSGRRRRAINRATLLAGIATGVLAVIFVISLLAAPFVAPVGQGQPAALRQGHASSLIAPRRARVSRHLVQQARTALSREMASAQPGMAPGQTVATPDTVVAAFYVVWNANGLTSLERNAAKLTQVMPEWLHLGRAGNDLDLRDWDPQRVTGNSRVVAIANLNNLDILPILNNAEGRVFDPARAALMLRSPARRRAVAQQVRDFVVQNGMDGVNVDFEDMADTDYTLLPTFIAELKAALPDTAIVSVDIEARLDSALVSRIAHAADQVILMTYAQNGPSQAPGPLSSLPWFDSVLNRLGAAVPSSKLVVGIGNYAVDWTRGAGGAPVSVHDAWVRAKTQRPGDAPEQIVDFDPVALNPTLVYTDSATRAEHEVWFLDAVSAYNQLRFAAHHRAVGTALWVLGAEDPSLWRLYDRRLRGVLPPHEIVDTVLASSGISDLPGHTGDILSVFSYPRDGLRSTERDSISGLLTDESYHVFPQPFVLRREGYHKGLLALTFDDGPDDKYTDMILDTLAELNVPGAFFLIGQNVERYPDVVRRIVAQGGEIGNHTFTHPNMGEKKRRRIELELNATQRIIQGVTGRATHLFRVPYNTDNDPENDRQMGPIDIANQMGYYTVGELLDPMDWELTGPDGRPRTVQQMVDTTVWQANNVKGSVILLHSAGGDRSRTVELLRPLVERLEEEGFRFVSLSRLIGVPRDSLMPAVTSRDLVMVGVDRITFEVLDVAENLLTFGFLAALVLAILRVAIVVPLALVSSRRARRAVHDPGFRPPVSVLIAAYNEATVIERTVSAALASDWPELEIVVVDDGSSDGTGDVVARAFAGEPRVRLLRQANGGKSSALNAAIALARHDILVCFDADTQVEPDAIGLLARHFEDLKVAAVAGNVKVGNRVNMLTIWQSIEYITSQNLDRRAYAMLNAVTVVPGAIGAWRRAAVLAVGGFVTDTLAEDMDLTWRLRRAGWRITADPQPVGWTEAPETFGPFLRQRFRWAFGSLQVLWKHIGALGRYGWFGRLVLPTQWLFGVVFQILGPIVDLRLLYALLAVVFSAISTQADLPIQAALLRILAQAGFFYALLFLVELAAAAVAFSLDEEDPKQLWWMFWQRFVYRQTMYYVLWKALFGAAKGKRHGWGKLQRTGSVQMEVREATP